tara:strand:+ start:1762 stop:2379 length:618 start_codon:yes stop_codon:yes gene_type:complete
MIEVVTRENRHDYQTELRQMFQQRHDIFVEQLKWNLPLAKDSLEQDQFDTGDAIYLLSFDKDRTLLGSKRLLPTTKPHLMSELFPHMVARDIPTGPHIWESSRSCVSPLCRNKGVIGELFLAMVEVGLMSGIEKITFVAGMDFYPTILHAGWGVVPLGFPEPDGKGQENIAGYLTIDPVSLHNMRRNYRVTRSVLHKQSPTCHIR